MKQKSKNIFLWLITVIFSYIIFDFHELTLDLAVYTLRGNFFSDVDLLIGDLMTQGITLTALFVIYFLIHYYYRRTENFDLKSSLSIYAPVIIFGIIAHPFFLYFYYDFKESIIFRTLFAANIFLDFIVLFGLHTFIIWNNKKRNLLLTVNFSLVISPILLFIIYILILNGLYEVMPKGFLEQNIFSLKGFDFIHIIGALLIGSYPFLTLFIYTNIIQKLEIRGPKFMTLIVCSCLALLIEVGFFIAIVKDPTVAII